MPDRAPDDDIDALHRDAAARRGIPVDDQEPAAPRGPGGLGGIALHPDDARHHVLGDPGAGMAVDFDLGLGVHAAAVKAGMAIDQDLERSGQADSERVRPARVQDLPFGLVGTLTEALKLPVQRAQVLLGQIELDHDPFLVQL
jgi:hypothetical protein